MAFVCLCVWLSACLLIGVRCYCSLCVFVVGCWLLDVAAVGCRVLVVACCVLFGVCYLLFAVVRRVLLFAGCCKLLLCPSFMVDCWMLFVECGVLLCPRLVVDCCALCVICCLFVVV